MNIKKNIINILVTGAGSTLGQAIIKSIKNITDLNVRLITTDYFNDIVGYYWCDKKYILPDILDKNVKRAEWNKSIFMEPILQRQADPGHLWFG